MPKNTQEMLPNYWSNLFWVGHSLYPKTEVYHILSPTPKSRKALFYGCFQRQSSNESKQSYAATEFRVYMWY